MANLKKLLPSGAQLEVTMASFSEANLLRKAVAQELAAVPLKLGIEATDLKSLLNTRVTDDSLNTLKNLVMSLIGSDTVEQALWPCLARATYNNKKIIPDLFEGEQARADFMPIAKEVLVYNLSPFFGSLGSLFTTKGSTPTSGQG